MIEPNPIAARLPSGAGAPAQVPDLIDLVADWLIAQALEDADFESLFEGCCNRLLGAGIPLMRGHISFSILHPLYASIGLTWRRGRAVETESHEHLATGEGFPEQFRINPLYHMIETRIPFLRRRLTGEDALVDFPVLREFREAGATDYLAYMIQFGGGELDGMVGSWCTDGSLGFNDHDIQSLRRIQQRLGVACKMRVKDQIARNVVTTYLGADAGIRVLSGQIRRGDGETISAVIWYSDLRGSTGLADTLEPEAYIRALNDYFEAAGGAVLAHGGEILNFIGDAVLAIFPIRKGQATVKQGCKRALAASADADRRLAKVNATRQQAGLAELSFGLGLHIGDVLFGNIGLPERLSFSVIGPTVNVVARIEALTKELNRSVLVSESFARNVPISWDKLGKHELPGIEKPLEVLAPSK